MYSIYYIPARLRQAAARGELRGAHAQHRGARQTHITIIIIISSSSSSSSSGIIIIMFDFPKVGFMSRLRNETYNTTTNIVPYSTLSANSVK